MNSCCSTAALPALTGLQFYYHEVIGFALEDVTHGDLGTIENVLDLPGNPLFKSVLNGKEGLFPMTDTVLKAVDRDARTVTLDLARRHVRPVFRGRRWCSGRLSEAGLLETGENRAVAPMIAALLPNPGLT